MCDNKKYTIDLDSLSVNNQNLDCFRFSDISKTKSIYRVGSTRVRARRGKMRTVTIYGEDIIVTLKLTSDVTIVDRNDIQINIESNHSFTKENYCGALTHESNSNNILCD